MLVLSLLFLTALALYAIARVQRKAFCTQYLFFLRYPLGFAL